MLSLTLKWTNRHHGLDEGRKFLRDTVARSDSPPCAASRPGLSSVAKHHTFGICRLRGPKSLNCRSLSPKSERSLEAEAQSRDPEFGTNLLENLEAAAYHRTCKSAPGLLTGCRTKSQHHRISLRSKLYHIQT